MLVVTSLVVAGSVLFASSPDAPGGDVSLDTVIFGDAVSARAHGMRLQNAQVVRFNETEPLGEPAAVHISDAKPGGRVLFDMKVDPSVSVRTHLTVKFWGGSLAGIPQTQRDTWLLDPKSNFSSQYGSSHNFPCELDQVDPVRGIAMSGPLPGRWQYATFALPFEWTALRTKITLGLGTGNFVGYGPPTYMPSRSLFRAYTHVSPYLQIPPAEQQGSVPPLAAPRKPRSNFTADVDLQIAQGVQRLLDSQLMNWSAVRNYQLPSAIYGAPTAGDYTFTCPQPYNRSQCKSDWMRSDDRGNLPWSTSLVIVAEAFASNASWARGFSGNPDVLRRIALALDVHVRAQGSNGGFRRGSDSTATWAGGPNRQPADNPLEGWAHASLARSFLLTHKALEAHKMLADKIDEDDDPSTPNITRKRAYTQLFNGSLSYLNSTGQTLCPNQEQGDAKAIFAANSALSFLNPSLAWTEDEMLGMCTCISPILPVPYGGRKHSSLRGCMRTCS
jgi:hypothetical protein